MTETTRDEQITKLERELAVIIRRFRREIHRLHGKKVSGHEFIFLAHLARHQPEKVSDIAKKFEVTASYATMVVDKLIKKGVVHRERSQKDRRVVQLTMTDKGMDLFHTLKRERHTFIQRMFANINDEELRTLLDLLEKLN
ncbi:MarR family transcriptional regulator [Sporolactobacillus sp. THM7-7]|nr:MarR family transcriptional regulator [Sporolactobacillus sp. THM7-7]